VKEPTNARRPITMYVRVGVQLCVGDVTLRSHVFVCVYTYMYMNNEYVCIYEYILNMFFIYMYMSVSVYVRVDVQLCVRDVMLRSHVFEYVYIHIYT